MRTNGSKNIKRFGLLTTVPTSATADVRHLASLAGNPLNQFVGTLNHQVNFLRWIETRHDLIVDLKKQVLAHAKKVSGKGPTGGKEGTFVKYRWYAEHLVILESINAFEAFYKRTLTDLGGVLQQFVYPSDDRTVTINARLLWGITGGTILPSLVPALVFEHLLFHDLKEVDRATNMLIGKSRYNEKSPGVNPLKDRVRALKGIFQVRHTLSHNCGLVTKADHSKFKALGLNLKQGEVIDPTKESLGIGILKELELEAHEFTEWLRAETTTYLTTCINVRKLAVPKAKRSELQKLLGTDICWDSVAWT